jgi:nicotinamide-nucleotide amidase
LQEQIEAIVKRLGARWRNVDAEAMREGARKQATIPAGATVLEPVGTAPGLVVAPAASGSGRHRRRSQPPAPAASGSGTTAGPTVVVLPGPPRELQPMWETSVRAELLADGPLRAALAGATTYRRRTLRLFGIPESEIAETLRQAEREDVGLERLEVTTCLKRGEVEVVTRYEPDAQDAYDALVALVRARHGQTLFSEDGSTVDEQVAALLRGAAEPGSVGGAGERSQANAAAGWTIATAESCTGGLLAARLTEPPGASEYVRGGIVAYSNEAKIAQAGVPAKLIERHGAVSPEVAQALAEGTRERLQADVGVGITGIAGPGGGTPEKPVGLVCLSVVGPGSSLTRSVTLPGSRADVRDRASTVALHMVRRLLIADASA